VKWTGATERCTGKDVPSVRSSQHLDTQEKKKKEEDSAANLHKTVTEGMVMAQWDPRISSNAFSDTTSHNLRSEARYSMAIPSEVP
jgi:hypothetical protein